MARFGDLDTQYFDDSGDPLVNGKIYFYESGTTTLKPTYADVNYTIANTNPVILTAAGRLPNVFFAGSAKAILATSAGTQIQVRDPVGDTTSAFGNAWVSSKSYSANSVVQGSDGEFYVSLTNGNVNNNPVSTTGSWTFLYSVEWSAGTTYKEGSVVTYESIVYQSLQNANLNQNPSTVAAYWTPIELSWISTQTYALNANVVGSDGILYTSLQAANIGNVPSTSPAWWVGTSAAAAASAIAAAASAADAAAQVVLAADEVVLATEQVALASGFATAASGSATSSSGFADASAASAVEAAASAAAAEAFSGSTEWVSGTTYALGDVVWSPIDFLPYRRIVAGAGTTDPSADATNWLSLEGASLGANTFTAAQEWATGSSVASAATIDLDTATGNRVHVTGTTTITAVTLTRGPRTVVFDGILTLTHHATNNNLPGAANITTAAGDRAIYESDGATVYCVSYTKASGLATVVGAAASTIVRSARTSSTILGTADQGTLIDITSGTFTQTFTAAATLGNGWFAYVRNSGTGDITLDPNASQTIDGLTSFLMYSGETRLIQCDGSNFTSVLLNPFSKTFTSSGSFIKPPGYKYFGGLLWGGGASGAKLNGKIGGSGGGGCHPFTLLSSLFSATETVTIAAVATGPSTDGPSVAGNTSSLGSIISAYGGGGSLGTTSTASGGAGGGALSAGQVAVVSGPSLGGGPAIIGVANTGFGGAGGVSGANGTDAFYGGGAGGGANSQTAGGNSVYGGGGSAGNSNSWGAAGTSVFGGSAGAGGLAVSGGNGVAPGGAGGGTITGTKAGDGARGELRIWGVA
jgi:hypothetical protein